MKCPRCGNEMELDAHRRYPINMCYNCGYMESQGSVAPVVKKKSETNYNHLAGLNFNETAAFIAGGLKVDIDSVKSWLDKLYD